MDPTVCMFFDRFLKILITLCYIKKMLFPLFFRNHSEAKDVSLGIWLTKNKQSTFAEMQTSIDHSH